jgi:sulfite exporter TauE/SafE/copper chaperone CopZ
MSKSTSTQEFYAEGMHCASCKLLIEERLHAVAGVEKVSADFSTGKIQIQTARPLEASELSAKVADAGYKIVAAQSDVVKIDKSAMEYIIAFAAALIFVGVLAALQLSGVIDLIGADSELNLGFVFLTGIIASLSTCMAVVGGLVLSLSSNYAKGKQVSPLITFHVSRVVSFFLLGGLIGLIGSAFTLSGAATLAINIVLFFAMLLIAIGLLDVLPQARKWQLRMPAGISKQVFRISQTASPVVLGALTFFLPCGFTQSMQLFALSRGSIGQGALTMFVFALGTLPVLALISFASIRFAQTKYAGFFYKWAGFVVIFFAIFNLLTALIAVGVIQAPV